MTSFQRDLVENNSDDFCRWKGIKSEVNKNQSLIGIKKIFGGRKDNNIVLFTSVQPKIAKKFLTMKSISNQFILYSSL